jgi:ABC-2 type transport system permease protein
VTTIETQPIREERTERSQSAGRIRPGRPHVIWAVFKRNFLAYFSNPVGYVFITLFVLVCPLIAFWQPIFFTNNLANLDQLNVYMPYVLLLFIPAITMNTWADERRQGTDELLLTLPAHDLDVVLGKYLAALGIYTVALVFSFSQVIVLMLLGSPDLGVIFGTYVGYWLMGAMLIAIGMVASMLSSNVTVAFILGALFCAIPIFLGMVGSLFPSGMRLLIEDWSVPAVFQDFGAGLIPLSGLVYFLGSAAAMLYVNMVLLSRRHWAGGEDRIGHWLHSIVRFAAVVVSLLALTVLIEHLGFRPDTSSEQLHTLSQESVDLAKNIPDDRPVLIQCYYSPTVPRDYVEVKSDLLGLLKEYSARSGGKIRLNLVPTEVFSEQAREAEKRFGIEPRRVFSLDQAKQTSDEVFLGVAFTSGTEEVVIPFFDVGLPVEYELTRSIRVVSRSGRKKVGILSTDAKLMGGLDMRTFSQTPEWSIVTELKKQYDVSSVSPDTPIASDLNVLLVAQPSSLTQKQIDNLSGYIKKGGGALLFLDPYPLDNPAISPELPKMPPGGPFGGGAPPEPKGNLRPVLDMIGLEWPSSEITFNFYNPHPKLADLQSTPEIVFIGKGSGAKDAFNEEEKASAGLQEIVALFPGLLKPANVGSGAEFTPLLRTGPTGGIIAFNDAVNQGFMGNVQISQRRRHMPTHVGYTLAARLTGHLPAETTKDTPKDSTDDASKKDDAKKKDDEKKKDADKKKDDKAAPAKINVIAIADLDLIGEQFFEFRRRKIEDLKFDNVPFVLNCVDVLAGDESFVSLRRKRPIHRRLDELESQVKKFDAELAEKTKQAEEEAAEELLQAQKAFDKEGDVVRNNTEWDERTKDIQLANLQRLAERRLDVKKQVIEAKKLNEIREAKAISEENTRKIRNRFRFVSAALPPLPPLILGLLVFFSRIRRENLGANPKRLA